jgi:Xaa-Pro aminopeptidase
MTDYSELLQRIAGRARFCRHRGQIKTPEILEEALEALDTERAAHEATKVLLTKSMENYSLKAFELLEQQTRADKAEAELQALREAAQGACDWMEGVRASGDAGNWNWVEGDEYSKLLQAITRKEA